MHEIRILQEKKQKSPNPQSCLTKSEGVPFQLAAGANWILSTKKFLKVVRKSELKKDQPSGFLIN